MDDEFKKERMKFYKSEMMICVIKILNYKNLLLVFHDF